MTPSLVKTSLKGSLPEDIIKSNEGASLTISNKRRPLSYMKGPLNTGRHLAPYYTWAVSTVAIMLCLL